MPKELIPIPPIDYAKLLKARGHRRAADVARAVGISRQYLNLIEKGERTPNSSILTKLCWLYDLQLTDITNGTPKTT